MRRKNEMSKQGMCAAVAVLKAFAATVPYSVALRRKCSFSQRFVQHAGTCTQKRRLSVMWSLARSSVHFHTSIKRC